MWPQSTVEEDEAAWGPTRGRRVVRPRRPVLGSACAALLLLSAFPHFAEDEGRSRKPNIVFILSDDQGIDGVGCYGSDRFKGKTPNLDSLAETEP